MWCGKHDSCIWPGVGGPVSSGLTATSIPPTVGTIVAITRSIINQMRINYSTAKSILTASIINKQSEIMKITIRVHGNISYLLPAYRLPPPPPWSLRWYPDILVKEVSIKNRGPSVNLQLKKKEQYKLHQNTLHYAFPFVVVCKDKKIYHTYQKNYRFLLSLYFLT